MTGNLQNRRKAEARGRHDFESLNQVSDYERKEPAASGTSPRTFVRTYRTVVDRSWLYFLLCDG